MLSASDIYNNKVNLWNALLPVLGNNEYAVAAVMGNIASESAYTFDPRIVQGYNASSFDNCVVYTNNVDSGAVSEYDFVHKGPNGGGYGLCQWTWYARKQNLYNLKNTGVYTSIGSLSLQVDFLNQELTNNYASLKSQIIATSESTLYDSTVGFMVSFENPANQTAAAKNGRYNNAVSLYNELSGSSITPGTSTDIKTSSLPIYLKAYNILIK